MDATTADAGKQPPPPSKRDGIEWLTPEEAAEVLNVSEAQLEKWRVRADGGPPWYRFGPRTPRYLRDELHAWARSKRATGPVADDEVVGNEQQRLPLRSGVSAVVIKNEGSE
jgi:excisionase family DNA binding protein